MHHTLNLPRENLVKYTTEFTISIKHVYVISPVNTYPRFTIYVFLEFVKQVDRIDDRFVNNKVSRFARVRRRGHAFYRVFFFLLHVMGNETRRIRTVDLMARTSDAVKCIGDATRRGGDSSRRLKVYIYREIRPNHLVNLIFVRTR